MTDDPVKMARLAQRDDRMATGALYGDLADRIEELEAKLAKAVEALTPSGETKAAYIGEVETNCPSGRSHTVSWTATKDIMKMIRHRAELEGTTNDQ